MKGIRDEVNDILTTEQRSKLEQIETKRKARHEEMLKRRMENLEKNPQ